jgi:two-component system NarL family response regulator
MSKIRLMLADDHSLVRIGLASVIGATPDLEICGEAETGTGAVDLYRSLRPDVALVDLRLPDISGVVVTERICEEFPDAKIVVLSSFAPDEEIHAAIVAGAKAYVLKTIDAPSLVKVIHTVASGRRFFPVEVAERLAARIPRSELTSRELTVLQHIVRGKRNREIATELGITEGTVKSHVVNILLKLGATDRTEAVTLAIERGIINVGQG